MQLFMVYNCPKDYRPLSGVNVARSIIIGDAGQWMLDLLTIYAAIVDIACYHRHWKLYTPSATPHLYIPFFTQKGGG